MEEPFSMRDPGTAVRNYVLPVPVNCAEGRIFAGDDKPLAGAMVELSVIMGGIIKPDVAFIWSTTDELGRYKLPGLPAQVEGGRMRIMASARGFITDSSPIIEFQAGSCKQVDIHLKPANIVSFAVKNRHGSVIPDAAGRLMPPSMRGSLRKGESAGILEWVAALDAAPVTCTISARGYKPVIFTLDPKSPPAEIILDAGESINGRVVSETGSPVRRAQVNVYGTRKDGGTSPPFDRHLGGRIDLTHAVAITGTRPPRTCYHPSRVSSSPTRLFSFFGPFPIPSVE